MKDIYYSGTEKEWNNILIGENAIPETATIHYDYKFIKSENISLSQYNYTYDGKAKEPLVTVKVGNETLINGIDYTVVYTNNIDVGTATVVITGKGKNRGTVTKTFTIVKKPSVVKKLYQKACSISAITLTWTKVNGAEGYEVYRATSKKGKYTKIASVTKTSYKNSKLKAGKTYYYKLRAYKTVNNAKVYGDYSTVVAAGTQTSKPSLKVVAGKKKATLTWKKVSGADGYEVQMSTSKSGKYKKIKTVNAKTVKYTKSKLTKGKKYFFKIRTYRTLGSKKIYSSWSTVKSVKIK